MCVLIVMKLLYDWLDDDVDNGDETDAWMIELYVVNVFVCGWYGFRMGREAPTDPNVDQGG